VFKVLSNGWMPLRSAVGLEYISRKAAKFAPVNYEKAVEPIVQVIERQVWPEIPTGNTFTQGSVRYNFRVDIKKKKCIMFKPVGSSGVEPKSKSSYCCISGSSDLGLYIEHLG
jgi:hypothetical protein